MIEYLGCGDREGGGSCDKVYASHAQVDKRCIFKDSDFAQICNECHSEEKYDKEGYKGYYRAYEGTACNAVLLKFTAKRWNELIEKLKDVRKAVDFARDKGYPEWQEARGEVGQVIRALRYGIDDPCYGRLGRDE